MKRLSGVHATVGEITLRRRDWRERPRRVSLKLTRVDDPRQKGNTHATSVNTAVLRK